MLSGTWNSSSEAPSTDRANRTCLTVKSSGENQNKIVPVRQIQNVIESKINGKFKGWEGETEYELTNGQVWKQATYKYQYKYPYMPSATLYETYSGMVMAVKGTRAKVRRVR